jgi:ABC-2 type transport system permease protein
MKNLLLLDFMQIRNRVKSLNFLGEMKAAIFLFLNLVFLAVLFAGSYRLLAYLNEVPMIGHLVVNKLLVMVFMTSFFMVAFSSVISSFTTIYFSKDLSWLLATPLAVKKIFAHKALHTVFYASWMVVALMLPFLAALAAVKGAGLLFLAGVLVLLVPFLVTAGLFGIIASMVLVRLFPARRVRDTMFVIGALFIMGLFMLFRFLQPEKLASPDGMDAVAQYLSFLDAPGAVYMPSWWLAGAVFSLLGGGMKNLFFYSGLLFGVAAVLFIFTGLLAEKIFLSGWAQNLGGRRIRSSAGAAGASPLAALLAKDAKSFTRDANQWSQLLFLAALSAVYLFSVYKIPLETMYLQNLVAFFNVGLIGFVVSAVALRFVFPAVSLEGDNLWLIKASPLTAEEFLREKTLFGSIPVATLALLLSVASGLVLKTDPPVFWASVAAVSVMAAGLNFMAAGFGAMFPKFKITSITQIESSQGGLFYILAAVFYVGLNLSLWAMPLQNYYLVKFGHAGLGLKSFVWVGMALLALNAAAMILPFSLGVRSLKRLEI